MNFLKNCPVIAAPMAGISDGIYRRICKACGAQVVVTEMISAEGLLHNAKMTMPLMTFTPAERPIGVQLFGAEPQRLALAAAQVEDLVHPDFIDLNSGCPVPKVVKRNGGAALLRDKKLFGDIITAMVKAVKTPVTVKIRSGWVVGDWIDVEFAKVAQDCGAAAITLHPRSKSMMFGGHSYWERITEVKNAVSIPVIGNGDITSPEHGLQMKTQTGCDALMIGRGAMGNPWIFGQVRDVLEGRPPKMPTVAERRELVLAHMRAYRDEFGPHKASYDLKKYCAWYVHGMQDAAIFRNKIFGVKEYGEMEEIIEGFFVV